MQLEQGVGAVTNVDAVLCVEAVLLELAQLVEKLRHADDAGAPDQVGRVRVDEAGRQDVEVVRDLVDDNRVARVVAAGGAGNDFELARENVDQLSLA